MTQSYQSYQSWVVDLNQEITRLGRHLGAFSLILDSRIPFDLGWTAARTARAMMGWSPVDRQRLIDAQRGTDTPTPATDLPAVPPGAVE